MLLQRVTELEVRCRELHQQKVRTVVLPLSDVLDLLALARNYFKVLSVNGFKLEGSSSREGNPPE